MPRIREGLTLALIAALPFHAIFVTVFTKLIAGPGHSPLPILALWKEGILGLVLLIALVEIAREWKRGNEKWKVDSLDLCIGGLLLVALILFFAFDLPSSASRFAFGFKYDFVPLVSFLILRHVSWSDLFQKRAVTVLLTVGAIVVTYGIAAMLLPQEWFTWLGYNDLHSLYVPGSPLAPFQQIESIGIRRMQSTFSGPNQMGIWLLIPLSIGLVRIVQMKGRKGQGLKGTSICALVPLLGVGILLSFSRSAWIAAAVIGAVIAWKYLPRKQLLLATCSLLILAIIAVVAFPSVILRATSSRDHLRRPLEALQIMREHPLGLGLGTAGPASNRFSDTCVDLPAGANASWAQAHPELCVFVGGEQVQPSLPSGELRPASQPADRTCSCPLLPENWYLQIGVELGWIGFILFLGLIFILLRRILKLENESIGLVFLGVSIAALFLHAWEDSAVALTIWVLIGVYLGHRGTS